LTDRADKSLVGVLDWLFLAAGVTLQIVVLSVMLRGPWREYPLLFLYLIASTLTTVVQVSFRYHYGPRSREFVSAYWTSDFLCNFIILLVIIHLIRTAMEGHPKRGSVYWGLLLGLAIVAAGTLLYMHYTARHFSLGRWMTVLGRDYYFLSTLLNAILWFTLLRANHPDRRLYLVTSGMGLTLSGAAIAHALRSTGTLIVAAGALVVFTYLAKVYIWYIAFRKAPAPVRSGGFARSGPGTIVPDPAD